MKNFIVLLTSLLLAGAANAGVAEFTTGDTQAEGWQDFQVAHTCRSGSEVHIPNHDASHVYFGEYGSGGRDNKGHISSEGAYCVHVWKIKKCAAAGRPVKLWSQTTDQAASLDEVCDPRCGDNAALRGGVCVTTNTDTPRVAARDSGQCPPNHAWQEQHQRCLSHAELDHFCRTRDKGKRNEIYLPEKNACGCAPGHSAQERGKGKSAFTQCTSFAELDRYCRESGLGLQNMVYLPEKDACGCPAGSSTQQKWYKDGFKWRSYDVCIPFADLDKFCRDTQKKVYDSTIGPNGACGKCIAEHSLQTYSRRKGNIFKRYWENYTECVPFGKLGAYCKEEHHQVYNPVSDKCERSCPSGAKTDSKNICRGCPAGHSWQESLNKCTPFADLGRYCYTQRGGQEYSPYKDDCVITCPSGRTPNSEHVCQ